MTDHAPETRASEPDDTALIEQAWLDIRRRGALREGLHVARAVAKRAADNPPLRARALHVIGHALSRLRSPRRALATLLESAETYHQLGDDRARANVYDTIGQVYAARGRLDRALHYYALSLVDKAGIGDLSGVAVTIGNIGRLQLRAGRYEDAIQCFERDLAMSIDAGDLRGQARMHEDLGRAWAGLEDDKKAEASFAACLALAEEHGFAELVFYAQNDLASLRIRQGRLDEAAQALDAAYDTGLDRENPYFALILEASRAEHLVARDDPGAIDALRQVLARLSRADLPDVEIPTRIRLAHALMAKGLKALAERVLIAGVRRARRLGTRRYLPALNEAMTALRVVEPALVEPGRERRPARDEEPEHPSDGTYVVLDTLGQGAHGEVYRAYDTVRSREVALKIVHLERIYDPKIRKRLGESVQVELEAASRVRHPGVARVYAIGRENDGGMYVVQEYVPGRSLRRVMEEEAEAPVTTVSMYGMRLAHALVALHEAEVVHRDLKPENVIVRSDDTPVLVDFGIAHLVSRDAPQPEIAGTREYMAPEQATGGAVDGRADLYALGVILFEWLVGFRPLQLSHESSETWREILVERKPPRVSELRPDVPDALDDLVAALLQKRRGRRPRDANQVAKALLAAIPELDAP